MLLIFLKLLSQPRPVVYNFIRFIAPQKLPPDIYGPGHITERGGASKKKTLAFYSGTRHTW